jgi:hypothetical protein
MTNVVYITRTKSWVFAGYAALANNVNNKYRYTILEVFDNLINSLPTHGHLHLPMLHFIITHCSIWLIETVTLQNGIHPSFHGFPEHRFNLGGIIIIIIIII